ncbi:MAG: hypothetical protein M1834_007856 [Cirrosporium novae-zelandiae]|nr:MAG: hypothetical protein M1834_007856 [Cirrosporium novae-zelandiae]
MALGGAFLRITTTLVRVIQLLASIVALGVFSYFLAVLAKNDAPIAKDWRAVEGMSGAATLYGIFAVLLTLCLGGVAFFAFLAIVLDICFVGCYIAIAILTRHSADSCTGTVQTPVGTGLASAYPSYNGDTFSPHFGLACRLEKAVFAVSIINIILFIISAALTVGMARHHKREKAYGPSPANNYTSGRSRGKFWQRKKRNTYDAEMAVAGGLRPSAETGLTGSTAHDGVGYTAPATADPKYGQAGYRSANF